MMENVLPTRAEGYVPTFRPFREENLTPLTLREELENHYLFRMITWLTRQGWQSAKAAGSLWQIAELAIVLVDWLKLNNQTPEKELLSRQVEIVLQQEIVPYLLRSAKEGSESLFTWDEHVYDTSEVVTALLSITEHFGASLPKNLRGQIYKACQGALKWIHLRSRPPFPEPLDALLAMKDSSLAMMLEV